MANELVEQLRQQIDAQHAEAIRALEIVGKYLSDSPNQGIQAFPTIQPSNGKKSNRQLVMDALRTLHKPTIADLVRVTGLEKLKVRGVLYAPGYKQRIKSHVEDGVAYYS